MFNWAIKQPSVNQSLLVLPTWLAGPLDGLAGLAGIWCKSEFLELIPHFGCCSP